MSKKVYGEWTATQGLVTVGGPIEDGDIATKGWVKGYVSDGVNVTVDDVLSDTSENPVQNKVIKKELDNKQPKGNYVTTTQLNGKSDKILEIAGGNGDVTQEIEPNKYYVFGECTTLNITLASEITGIFNEYLFKFTSGSTATVLNLPATCKWIGDNTIEANKEYIVSIVDNLAVLGGA